MPAAAKTLLPALAPRREPDRLPAARKNARAFSTHSLLLAGRATFGLTLAPMEFRILQQRSFAGVWGFNAHGKSYNCDGKPNRFQLVLVCNWDQHCKLL